MEHSGPEGTVPTVTRAVAPVVVGVGAEGDTALEWAVRHARRAGRPVHLVRAYDPTAAWPTTVAAALGVPAAGMRDVLARAVRTRGRHAAGEAGWPPDGDPLVAVTPGDPVDVLVAAARDASMLVVGHRDGRAAARWGLGSVGLGVLWHATTTVTVVRPAPDDGPVVVGTDGSFDATAALRHALVHAALRGVRTIVVGAGTAARPEWLEPHLHTTQREIEEEDGISTGPVEVVVDHDHPVRALLGAVARHTAALLVVGHRGLGHVASLAFGSVGHELVVEAPVPVSVVRALP